MSQMRLKGEGVEVDLSVDGTLSDVFALSKSADVTLLIANQQDGYLGHSSDFTDETFEGADLKVNFHNATAAYISIMKVMVRRAKSRAHSETVDVTMRLEFPDGTVKKIMFPDVKSRNMALSAGGRKDFVGGDMDLHSDDVKFL